MAQRGYSGDRVYYLLVGDMVDWIPIEFDRDFPFHLIVLHDTFEHGAFVKRTFERSDPENLTPDQAKGFLDEETFHGLDLFVTLSAKTKLKL